jgi:hypothetical protein
MAMLLCLAFATAAMPHVTGAHAAAHGHPAPFSADAAGPSSDDYGGGHEQGLVDSCVVAAGCFFWLVVSEAPELRWSKAGVILRASRWDRTQRSRAPTPPPPRLSLSI